MRFIVKARFVGDTMVMTIPKEIRLKMKILLGDKLVITFPDNSPIVFSVSKDD